MIGRDPEAHIHLPDDEISWRHAVIEQRNNGVFIRDMGSLNRILVNGRDVREARLEHEDEITIGKTTMKYITLQVATDEQERRVGHVQRITYSAVIMVLLLEFILLMALSFWQIEKDEALSQLPAPMHEEGIVEEATDTEPDGQGGARETEATALPDEKTPSLKATPASAAPPGKETSPTPGPVETSEPDVIAQIEPVPETTPEDIPELPSVVLEGDQEPQQEERTPRAQEPAPAEESERGETEEAEPASTAEQPAEPPPLEDNADDPLMEIAREMMEEALLEIRKHNYVQADQQLERVQIVSPEFFPAYAERALLYEKRGMLKEAGQEWTRLMRQSSGTPWHPYAVNERTRVARAEMLQQRIEPPSVHRPGSKPGKLPENIRIDAVEKQTFQRTREYDEMRMLNIVLRQRMKDMDVQGEDVQVKVSFYDKIKGTSKLVPTQAVVPDAAITLKGRWPPGERRAVSAAYIVPVDFRTYEEQEFGNARAYYGYVVRVYYEGLLQDQTARPRKLLDLLDKQ